MWPFPNFHLLIFKNSILLICIVYTEFFAVYFLLAYLYAKLFTLLFLSVVHEYAYFSMNIFGNRSISLRRILVDNILRVFSVIHAWVEFEFADHSDAMHDLFNSVRVQMIGSVVIGATQLVTGMNNSQNSDCHSIMHCQNKPISKCIHKFYMHMH